MGRPPGGVVQDCLHTFGTDIRRGLVDLKEGFCWNGKDVLNWETEGEEEDGEGDGEDTDVNHWTESAGGHLC